MKRVFNSWSVVHENSYDAIEAFGENFTNDSILNIYNHQQIQKTHEIIKHKKEIKLLFMICCDENNLLSHILSSIHIYHQLSPNICNVLFNGKTHNDIHLFGYSNQNMLD